MSFRIDINNREFRDWFKQVTDKSIRRHMLTRIGSDGREELKEEAKKISVTNELFRSMDFRINGGRVSIHSRSGYGDIALEYGRKPGKMPPPRLLDRWARKRGLSVPGIVIAKSIAKKGTKKHRKGGPKQVTRATERIENTVIPKAIDKYLKNYD